MSKSFARISASLLLAITAFAPVSAQDAAPLSFECREERSFTALELGELEVTGAKMLMKISPYLDANQQWTATSGFLNFSKPTDPSLGAASPVFRISLDYLDIGNTLDFVRYREPFLQNLVISLQLDALGLGQEDRPVKILFQTQSDDGGQVFNLDGTLMKKTGNMRFRNAIFNPIFLPAPDQDTDSILALLSGMRKAMRKADKIVVSVIDVQTNETIGYSQMRMNLAILERFRLPHLEKRLIANPACPAPAFKE